jgi:hypothetical protein
MSVHRSACGGDELQNFCALDLSLQSALNRFNLAAQAAPRLRELALLSDGV